MARDIHDHYFHQAKAEGYRSRAAYKLIEIDDRKKILKHGDNVLDAGCAPGSWLQVAARRVGRKGFVVGIDKQPVELNFQEDNIIVLLGDLAETPAAELLAPLPRKKTSDPFFNVLLSDMAPFTTGDRTIDHHKSIRLCHALLDMCGDLLRSSSASTSGGGGGNLVMKVFEGEVYPELITRARAMFNKVKGFKPKASRSESTEIYLIAHGFTGIVTPLDAKDDESPPDPRDELPKRKPSPGWGA